MRISDWSSDVCSSDLEDRPALALQRPASVLAERDVLPADLAHAVRGRCRSGGFEIDDADDLTRGHASKWARRRAIAPLFRRARKKRRKSEERRVGKEVVRPSSSWGWRYNTKKK